MAYDLHELEYTALLQSGEVVHYTCNPPSLEMRKKYGIEDVDSDPEGFLLIPGDVFVKFGLILDPLHDSETHKLVSEQLMRKMSEKEKKLSNSNRF